MFIIDYSHLWVTTFLEEFIHSLLFASIEAFVEAIEVLRLMDSMVALHIGHISS